MINRISPLLIACVALITGCSGEFWGGTGAGAVGAGAAYELSGRRELDRLEEDRKAGKISQQEYEIRKDQIERDHLLK